MTPILRKGDKVHFSVPIAGPGMPRQISEAEDAVAVMQKMLKFHGITTVGWTANTGILAPQINFIIREEPDA